jgi:hypothetical protein
MHDGMWVLPHTSDPLYVSSMWDSLDGYLRKVSKVCLVLEMTAYPLAFAKITNHLAPLAEGQDIIE